MTGAVVPNRCLMRIALALILICSGLAVGTVGVLLNHKFYSIHGPFYDSMSYLNQLAWVMQNTEENGLWVALKDSYSSSTVFLPWLVGAPVAYVTEPSRILGVVIQMPLIFLQLFTGYRFFKIKGAPYGRAALYSLPLISYPAIFHFNGGLGDFRMDLSQALTYGSFLAALMVARMRDSLKEWAFVGFVISVGCLVRATTPVYVVAVLGAAFLFDTVRMGLIPTLQRYSLTGSIVVLLTGWFYLLNYEFLHYYYFIWNTDANARLSLRSSVAHVFFVARHLGIYLVTALLVLMAVVVPRLVRDWRTCSQRINWIALVGALVPTAYLVLSGAGLNPFVSMVAVPGFILFTLDVADCSNTPAQTLVNRAAPIILVIAMAASTWTAIADSERNISDWIPDKQGIAHLLDIMDHDVRSRKLDHIRIAFVYQGSVDHAVITNHLLYEKGYKYRPTHELYGQGMTIGTIRYGFGSEVEWNRISGATDQEKLEYIVNNALEKADFIVMADADSRLPTHHRINRYAEQLRALLESSRLLEKLESRIVLSGTEKVTVYRVIRHQSTRLDTATGL